MLVEIMFGLAIIINIYWVYNYSKKSKYENVYFGLGILAYFILPIFSLYFEILEKNQIYIDFYYKYSDLIKPKIFFLISWILIMECIFFISTDERIEKNKIKNIKIDNLFLKLMIVSCYLVLFFIYYTIKNFIFKGYQNYGNNRALIASLLNISFSCNLYFLLKNEKKISKNMVGHFLISIPLLIMGTRMYFICHLISYATFLVKKKIIKKKIIIINAIILFFVMAIISLKRLGQNIVLKEGILNNLKEFLFTGISYISFVGLNELPFIEFPNEILYKATNLMPRILRVEIISENKYVYESPFGAKHIMVSLSENFGLIGAIIFIYILGYIIKKLEASKNLINNTMYYIILGTLPLLFFRDPIEIFLYKINFQYSYVILWFLYFVSRFFQRIKASKHQKESGERT